MISPLLILCLLPTSSLALRVASFFQDGMVLQRAPQSARIYGFDAISPDTVQAFVSCSLDGQEFTFQAVPLRSSGGRSWWDWTRNKKADGYWEVDLPPQTAGTLCDITIMEEVSIWQAREEVSLTGILFGDVWLCSGQSNMVFTMNGIFNASEEISDSASYTNIRYTVLSRHALDQEQEDNKPLTPWSDPSNSGNLGSMSAVCFLYARNVYDMMKERGESVPIGLIDSAWGGTRVEAWSTKEALDSCGVEEHVDQSHAQNSNSYLWNGCIAPLRRMKLTGFLWYQGEANSHWNKNLYNCTFPTLIDSWRQEFNNENAPFGFVQLSTVKYGITNLDFCHIRAHQTADYFTVPNDRMPNTFMAVAVDTYDDANGIHPRFKQVVGQRLAVAGMSVAYGVQELPNQGPVATSVTKLEPLAYRLTYDQDFIYDDSELTGFFVCCGLPDLCRDSSDANIWAPVPNSKVKARPRTMSIDLDLTGGCSPGEEGEGINLAYLWRQTPIETPVWGAPIYSADQFKLPSPPWMWMDI